MAGLIIKDNVIEIIQSRLRANEMCLKGAKEKKLHEEQLYFQHLEFEDTMFLNSIEKLIPIEERKQGKWKEIVDSDCIKFCNYVLPRIKCSCCDYEPWDSKDCNYCPNCGADMRGSEE